MARHGHAAPDLEEEELGGPAEATPAQRAPVGFADAGPRHGPWAPFALGAILVLASMALLVTAFTQDYYEVDVRQGPQPDGDTDTSDRVVVLIGLREAVGMFYDDGVGDPSRETQGWDDHPIIGVVMKPLAWTGYVGAGLIGLAFLAGLLHRLGALTVPGPAPIMALFGIVVLTTGLVPFILDIAHHVRVEMVPGRLDLAPAFWTSNADGDFAHDLFMGPRIGFWLHAGGIAAGAVGTVLMFWHQIEATGRSLRVFAESAAPRLD